MMKSDRLSSLQHPPGTSARSPTLGVFDSGFGGLTVLRSLLPLIPGARYLYLGDTARLPYGAKSRETIARYAVSSAKFLHEQGADLLVIACNTATALALDDIQRSLPIPVIGVIEPGAQAALAASRRSVPYQRPVPSEQSSVFSTGPGRSPMGASADFKPGTPSQVLVLATTATVQSHAYTEALIAVGLAASEKACPLLVPLVEEGWIDHPVTDEVLKIYLMEALARAPTTQTLLLGCTHYPLLEPAIHRVLGDLHHPLTVIDSADATAHATANAVRARFPNLNTAAEPACTFFATDSIEKFQRLGSRFLGRPLDVVQLIDLGG